MLRRVMMAGAAVIGSTFDPAAKGSGITLSNGNLDAAGAAGSWESAYCTAGKSTGKHQFEMVHLSGTGVSRPFAGLADKTNPTNVPASYLGQNGATVFESIGYWGNGAVYHRLASGAGTGSAGASAFVINDVITVTLDLTLGSPQVVFYLNGASVGTFTLPSGKTWFPAMSGNGGAVRFRPATLAFPVSGFTDWG